MEPIPVERLARPLDAFRCTPFAAVITARTCLARRGTFTNCGACPLGAQVAERVEAEAPKGDRCEVCGKPVKGAKGRRPLCPTHRGSAR